jgi:hypothetical protein
MLQFWKYMCINIFLMRDAQIKCAGSPWQLNFERLRLIFLRAGVLSMELTSCDHSGVRSFEDSWKICAPLSRAVQLPVSDTMVCRLHNIK